MTANTRRIIRRPLKTLASYVFLVVSLSLLAFMVANQWEEFSSALHRMSLWNITLAALTAIGFSISSMFSWRWALASTTGQLLGLRPTAQTFFVSQLGKYIPGAVWPVLAQMELTNKYGATRAQSVLGSTLAMIIGLASAITLGGISVLASGISLLTYWFLVPVAIVCSLVLTPPILRLVVQMLGRRISRFRSLQDIIIDGRSITLAIVWNIAAWIFWGTQAWIILRAFAPIGFGADFLLTLGAFALSFAVGFVIIIAPGGIGPREAALVFLLSSLVGTSDALALAIVSRLFSIVFDAIGAGIAWLSTVTQRKQAHALITPNSKDSK